MALEKLIESEAAVARVAQQASDFASVVAMIYMEFFAAAIGFACAAYRAAFILCCYHSKVLFCGNSVVVLHAAVRVSRTATALPITRYFFPFFRVVFLPASYLRYMFFGVLFAPRSECGVGAPFTLIAFPRSRSFVLVKLCEGLSFFTRIAALFCNQGRLLCVSYRSAGDWI